MIVKIYPVKVKNWHKNEIVQSSFLLLMMISFLFNSEPIGFTINTIIDLSLIFMFALSMLFFLRKVAKHPLVGLIDKPNERKLHQGSVPLVGGISICLSILYFLYNNPTIIPHSALYSFGIVLLVVLGILNYKFYISFKLRLMVLTVLATISTTVLSKFKYPVCTVYYKNNY